MPKMCPDDDGRIWKKKKKIRHVIRNNETGKHFCIKQTKVQLLQFIFIMAASDKISNWALKLRLKKGEGNCCFTHSIYEYFDPVSEKIIIIYCFPFSFVFFFSFLSFFFFVVTISYNQLNINITDLSNKLYNRCERVG